MSAFARRALLILLVCAAAAAGGYWWYARQRAPAATAQPPTPPAPEVGVVAVQPAEVPFPVQYAGRVVAFRTVEVRPRVGGLLLSRDYQEGTKVLEGQVLFRIDPATYEAVLMRAEAQLHQAEAARRQAEENYKRIEELARRQVSTQQQLDQALAQRDQARAAVELAQAEVETAKLNLSYTTVTAPVTGVTALQSPPVGTLIQAAQTVLTTITVLDPAYVSFSFTDREGQRFRELNQRRARPISEKDLTVELRFGKETVYPHPGRIDTAAQRVDPETGTIEARAIFPNADGILLPGQFVRVVIHGITLPDAIVVPEPAVSQGPQGPSVFVVNDKNAAETRLIRLGPELQSGWVVEDGLQGGERVVVDGVIRVRPGAPVRPVPTAPPAAAQAAGSSPAGARP